MSMNGQSSGDFRETSGRVQLFHVVTRNSVGVLAADAFTQANPALATGATKKSTTLSGITKTGVLGGSFAFTRPVAGNNVIGGPAGTPADPPTVFSTGMRPLGIFLNDAAGNAYENTPGTASGRGPYVCGSGSCVGLTIYETQIQLGGSAGNALTYAAGDLLYASINGLITNVSADSLETSESLTPTVVGVLKAAVDATTPMLIVDLRI